MEKPFKPFEHEAQRAMHAMNGTTIDARCIEVVELGMPVLSVPAGECSLGDPDEDEGNSKRDA